MSVLMILVMLILFAFAIPVAIAMGGAAVSFILLQPNVPLVTVAQRMFNGADSYPLLAIPFFMLAGEFMNRGGVTTRLVAFAEALVGHIQGGLAHANIVTGVIMAGMSGSAVADASGVASIMVPAMKKAGYPVAFAAAVTAGSAVIGPVIPPSTTMIIYASVAEVSVGKMFVGGVIPGLGMALYMMVVAYIISKRRGYGNMGHFSWRHLWRAFVPAIFPMLTPVIILGGILSGFFTPTEAAVVASVYAFVLAMVYREVTWRDVPRIMSKVMANTAVVMFIVATSSLIGWLVAMDRLAQGLVTLFSGITDSPAVILAILNVILLILGMIMDSPPIIILVTPMLMPLLNHFGIDPVQWGVVMTVNLMIGLITPPVGMVTYVCTSIAKVELLPFIKEAIPFMIALVLLLITITYIPATITWLPSVVFGR